MTARARIVSFGPEGAASRYDSLVVEEPMEIRLGATQLAVIMRTPGHEEDLVLGFALTEGIVGAPGAVAGVRRLAGHPEDARWELVLAEGIQVEPEQFRRTTYSTSSCGVCGKASIDAVRVAAARLPEGPQVETGVLTTLPRLLRERQDAFDETGGLHAAAAFTPAGGLVEIREDVGRHNAVDKVVGALAGRTWPLPDVVLMVSGRVSFEIAQKAAVAGIPVVCGVSAASALAVALAEELGMTLVGFLREGGFNVYAGEQRLVGLGL